METRKEERWALRNDVKEEGRTSEKEEKKKKIVKRGNKTDPSQQVRHDY